MTADETKFFTLVDDSRTQHCCFLAEMFLWNKEKGYSLNFRPLGGTEDSPGRYACKYLSVPIEEVRIAGEQERLSVSLIEKLDSELPALSRSALP